MAFRPAGALNELVRMGLDRLRGLVFAVWAGWFLFVLVVAAALSGLAYAFAAPWWLYWVIAALGLLLLAPVVLIGLVAMAAARAWSEKAEMAARMEAAAFAQRADVPGDERPPARDWPPRE